MAGYVETNNAADLSRYTHYIDHAIDETQIADVDKAMLEQRDMADYTPRPVRENIKSMFPSEFPEETKEAYLVEKLLAEFELQYMTASKQSIVDYILMACCILTLASRPCSHSII